MSSDPSTMAMRKGCCSVTAMSGDAAFHNRCVVVMVDIVGQLLSHSLSHPILLAGTRLDMIETTILGLLETLIIMVHMCTWHASLFPGLLTGTWVMTTMIQIYTDRSVASI